MPRKTARISEIRALANRMLAGTDPELTDLRRGVAAMYESIAMAANDYHGYNDIVAVWTGEPGHSTYVPDETYRRVYYGEMSGPDAERASAACAAYRESTTDVELSRRRESARTTRLDRAASSIAAQITSAARGSGTDPIAWVTGNSYMPPLRSFTAAEQVYQADPDGEDFAYLAEQVERQLGEAGVALECPDYDNALYAVDLRRFEYEEDPDGETLQADWKPKADAASARILRTDLPLGSDQDAWLVCYRGQHFVISNAEYSSGYETQVFRANEDGTVRSYTEIARGDDQPAALSSLCARPVDDTGYVLSPTDVQDMIDGAEDDPARLAVVEDDLRRYRENAHQLSSPYNLPVMCGDCGDELVFPVDEVPVHKNDGTPWCQNRDDATRRHPGRFAPGQQPGQSPAPDHNCTQCGCSSGQPRKPVDQELYDRTAPSWTCITEPGQGPHYAPHGNCLWCGMSALGIQEEADTRRQQASGAWHGISRVVGHYAADCPGPELCDQRGSQQVTPDTSDHYPSTENSPGF